MKRKRVWRYYCEFCGKTNCSASSISRHEKRCTMNPDRHCGMCATSDLPQKPMPELLATLEGIEISETTDEYGVSIKFEGDMDAALLRLRDKAENCPACILAALRQKGIPVPMTTFKFTDECHEFWHNVNNDDHDGTF